MTNPTMARLFKIVENRENKEELTYVQSRDIRLMLDITNAAIAMRERRMNITTDMKAALHALDNVTK